MERTIIVTGGTWDELITEIAASLRNVPVVQIKEKIFSHRKGSQMVGCDVRTFNKILRRNNITRVTASVIESIRQSELK